MSEFDGLRLAASQVSGGSCCFDAGKPGHRCPRFVAVPAADIPALLNRLEAAERKIAAVEALADEWEELASDTAWAPQYRTSWQSCAGQLRAALAAEDTAGGAS